MSNGHYDASILLHWSLLNLYRLCTDLAWVLPLQILKFSRVLNHLREISAPQATKASDPEPFQSWAEVHLWKSFQVFCYNSAVISFAYLSWGVRQFSSDLMNDHLLLGSVSSTLICSVFQWGYFHFFWWSDKAHLTWALRHSCLCPTPPFRALVPHTSQYYESQLPGQVSPLIAAGVL